jgi:hypothetical protein
MIFYFIGVVLAVAGLFFGDLFSLFIALLVTSLGMLDERRR